MQKVNERFPQTWFESDPRLMPSRRVLCQSDPRVGASLIIDPSPLPHFPYKHQQKLLLSRAEDEKVGVPESSHRENGSATSSSSARPQSPSATSRLDSEGVAGREVRRNLGYHLFWRPSAAPPPRHVIRSSWKLCAGRVGASRRTGLLPPGTTKMPCFGKLWTRI